MNAVAMKPDTLMAVSGLIERCLGLHFPSERHDALARGLAYATAKMGSADPEAYAARLLVTGITPVEQDTLAQALTVGETYLFREPATLKALEEHVLPALIDARSKRGEKRLRLWSAGCCTGEEAYTLAIMLARLIPSLTEWDITILATDINPDFLCKARTGRYREWSFRGAPAWLKDDFFSTCANDEFELTARVRHMVSFSYLNLAEDSYPSLINNTSAMDVILCRNVMMYFAADCANRVIGRFHQALLDGGWLVLSPSEDCNGNAELFTRTSFDDATLYRKRSPISPCIRPPTPNTPRPASAPIFPVARSALIPRPPAPASVPAMPAEAPLASATAAYVRADYEAVVRIAAARPASAVDLLALAARAAANLGRLDEALEWCETALQRDTLQASVHLLQATILVARHDEPEALEALKRVLYLEPHSILAHFTMANLMLQTGEPAKAMKGFRKTIRLLHALEGSTVVPDSDGLTAERLLVMVKYIQESMETEP